MSRVIIISGFLFHLSDTILPLLDESTDVFVHTWDTEENKRWINKLKRYNNKCNLLSIEIEKPKYERKLHSYFYSTWKSINNIPDLDKYETILKFKPNIDSHLTYKGDLKYYFTKGYLQSYPLLKGFSKEDCIFGSIYYQTMDERVFTGYPKSIGKVFNLKFEEFHRQMVDLDEKLIEKYGPDYEGSIFWKYWIENKGVKIIQDLDLKIPNNVR